MLSSAIHSRKKIKNKYTSLIASLDDQIGGLALACLTLYHIAAGGGVIHGSSGQHQIYWSSSG